MKFYVLKDDDLGVVGCVKTLSEAKQIARLDSHIKEIEMIDLDVNADTVRRLLGNEGGYAKDIKITYVN
jgi:hypothetical protein